MYEGASVTYVSRTASPSAHTRLRQVLSVTDLQRLNVRAPISSHLLTMELALRIGAMPSATRKWRVGVVAQHD